MEVFTKLPYIEAAYNMITKVPPIPPWMTILWFNGNPVTDISNIYNATQLEEIDFSDNGITLPIPSTFSRWPNLKILRLPQNNFYGELQETAFSDNHFLEVVDLSANNVVGASFHYCRGPPPSLLPIPLFHNR
jgi:Leucine-rich repeat (LRR) protein